MFTVPPNTEISVQVIKDAIQYNNKKRSRYDELENYYLGKHPILSRTRGDTFINNKIVVNHAKYIVDVNTGYLLGLPLSLQVDSKYDIEPIKEEYNKQNISNLDNELGKDTAIFGRQYELVYLNGNNIKSKDIDVRNCVIVYDDTIDHEKMFAIIYREDKGKGKYEDILVYDKQFEYQYAVAGEIQLKTAQPHYFEKVPVIEYKNNSEKTGDFENVMTLIDAYNKIQSDRLNDKEQLVDALLLVYGMTLTDKQRNQMRESRLLAGLDKDTKVEFLIKQLNEADGDVLRGVIERDIHKISNTPNLSDENFVGNSSGVALKYKLLSFEQNIVSKERNFEVGQVERFELYNNYLVKLKKMTTKIPVHEVDVVFKRYLPENLLEISQMVANFSGIVDQKTLLEQVPFVRDASQVMETLEEEDTEEEPTFGTFEPTEPIEEATDPVKNEL